MQISAGRRADSFFSKIQQAILSRLELEQTIAEEEGEDEEGRLAEEEAKVKEKAEKEARSKLF